ncbi:hypothetical protein NL676_021385 [Syzygium grande]|nr:hypothetical protein NL676_021385 [Syzygium grande]
MRFKCIRKGWQSLISDLGFARMHLKRLEAGDMIPSQRIIKNCPLETVDHDVLDGGGDGSDDRARSLIYNPTTKASRELPDYYVQAKLYSGFGYDPRSDDYKIVQVGLSGLSADEWQVVIYSLKSGCWRSIRAQPESHPANNRRGVYWSGALHWCVIDWSRNNADGESMIMSFDLSEEKFRRMLPVPRAAGNMAFAGEGAFAGLGVHRDGLFIYKGVRDHCFKGWITNEYGGKYAVEPDSIESAAIYLETLVSSYPSPDAGLHLPVMISVLRMILHDATRFD